MSQATGFFGFYSIGAGAAYSSGGVANYDNFVVASAGQISTVRWAGLFALDDGADFPDCAPSDLLDGWVIRVREDDNGLPGVLIAEYAADAGTLTIESAEDAGAWSDTRRRYVFEASLTHDVAGGGCYWFSIERPTPTGSNACEFYWETSLEGDGFSYNTSDGVLDESNVRTRDLAWCLDGTVEAAADTLSCATSRYPRPANANLAGAVALALGNLAEGSTRGAPIAVTAPFCDFDLSDYADPSRAPGVWYTITSDITQDLVLDAVHDVASIDMQLAVYCGSSIDELRCVTGTDQRRSNAAAASVRFRAEAGVPYYVLVLGAPLDQYAEFSIIANAYGGGEPVAISDCLPGPCELVIPEEALDEGETSADSNGGCNSTPPVFAPNVDCAIVVSGTAWASQGFRDTDWYQFTVTETSEVTWTVEAEFPPLAFLFNQGGQPIDCAMPYTTVDGDAELACGTASVSAVLSPGVYVAWAGPYGFSGVPFDGNNNRYVATLTACERPDLTIDQIDPPTEWDINTAGSSPLDVAWETRNIGPVAAGAWEQRVYVSTDDVVDPGDLQRSRIRYADGLPPGETVAGQQRFPGVVGDGLGDQIFVIVQADTLDEVLEGNEANNETAFPIDIVAPDLIADSLATSFGSQVNAGRTVPMTFVVRNEGDAWPVARPLSASIALVSLATGSDAASINVAYPEPTIPAGGVWFDEVDFTIPETIDVGNYRFELRVNTRRDPRETDYSNNELETGPPFQVVKPDLSISGISGPSILTVGAPATLSWDIGNSSSAGPLLTSVRTHVIRSDDGVFGDADDTVIAVLPPLQPGDLAPGGLRVTQQYTWTPTEQDARQGAILFIEADGPNDALEIDEGNNWSSFESPILGPDLVPVAVQFQTPSQFTWSSPTTTTVTILNEGTTDWPAQRFFIDFALLERLDDGSVVTRISNFATLQVDNSAIPAGVDSSFALELPFAAIAEEGEYLLQADVNANRRPEVDFTNNTRVSNSAVLALPDLVPSDLRLGSMPSVGIPVEVTFTLSNPTDRPALGQPICQLYWSEDGNLGVGDRQVAATQLDPDVVPPGGSLDVTLSWTPTLAEALVDGSLILVVDDTVNNQPETDDSNNEIALGMVGVAAPDLVAGFASTAPVVWDIGESAGSQQILIETENVGDGAAAAPWTDDVLFSVDQTVDASDVVVGSILRDADLAGGGTSLATVTLNPAGVGGVTQGFLIARADRDGQVGESDEANNTGVSAVSLLGPDLVIDSVTFVPTFEDATFGAQYTANIVVRNAGTAAWPTGGLLDISGQICAREPGGGITAVQPTFLAPGGAAGLGVGETRTVSASVVLEVQGTPAQVFARFEVNPLNAPELDFSNNTFDTPDTEYRLADLAAGNIGFVDVPVAGLAGEVRWEVQNLSDRRANGLTTTRVFWGPDAIFDGNERLIASRQVDALFIEPGGVVAQSIDWAPSPSDAAVDGFFFVQVDATNAIPELDDTGNNVASAVAPVTIADLVALDAGDLSTVVISEPAEVTFSYRNDGGGRADASDGAWTDRVYLSADDQFSGDDLLLGSVEGTVLAPGEQRVSVIAIELSPAAMPIEGDAFVILVADASGEVVEADTANNALAVPVTVARPDGPDLRPTLTFVADSGLGDETTRVSWLIENIGEVSAGGPWVDRVYLSEDETFGGGDELIGEFGFAGVIEPGGSELRTVSATLPDIDGDRFVIVVVDATNDVGEVLDEDNNIAVSDTTIAIVPTPKPDLVVADVRPLGVQPLRSTDVFSGSDVVVEFTIRNDGLAPTSTPVWRDYVYLSTDDVLDAGDTRIARPENPIFLQPGESYIQMVPATLPNDIVGSSFRLIVVADEERRVRESDEDNNESVSPPFAVQLEPQPDLIVRGVRPSTFDVIQAGVPFEVRWETTNSDEAPTAGGPTDGSSWRSDIYISDSPTLAIEPGDERIGQVFRSGAGVLASGATEVRTAMVTVPFDRPGTGLYLKVVEDADDRVSEFGLEGNNIEASASPVTVRPTPPVNLVATAVTVSPIGLPGHEIVVQYSAENFANLPLVPYSWRDRAYLSLDGEFDLDTDIPLSPSFPRSSGVPLDPYTSTRTVRLPNSVAPGTYTLIINIDDQNSVPEGALGELDNARAAIEPIVIEDRAADLTIALDGVQPIAAAAGESVAVPFVVSNVGDAPTPVSSWRDRILFSTDASVGGDDVLLTRSRSAGLNIGQSYARTETVSLPYVRPGSYWLIVQTDASSQVFEGGNAAANVVALPVTITDDVADLVVSSVNAVSTADSGDMLTATWQVENVGTRPTNAGSWSDRLELIDTGTGSVVASAPATTHFGGLPAGGTYAAAASLQVPWGADGSFALRVRTDVGLRVFEASDSNNEGRAELEITLTPPGNLVALAPQTPGSVSAGESVTLGWTVRNDGPGVTNVSAWTDRMYLSFDRRLDDGDRQLASAMREAPLASGGQYSVQLDASIPADAAGTYFLIVETDTGDTVFENGLEQDNRAASVGSFTVAAANLVAESVSGASQVNAGQPIALTWSVRNDGEAVTPAGTWRDALYLSRNQFVDAGDPLLGSVPRVGALAPGETYQGSASLQVPAGLSGPYFVLLQTDSASMVPEGGRESDNGAISTMLVDVVLPPPADLAVRSIAPPSSSMAGEVTQFSWQIENAVTSPSAAVGQWEDSLFLSEDAVWDPADPFVGRATTSTQGPLLPGQAVAGGGSARIPPVVPGEYFLVVRADGRNVIPETDESNNTGVSAAPFEVTAVPLELGVPFEGAFAVGSERYFQIDVPAGEFLRITLDHSANGVFSELYLKREQMPTPGNFDRIYESPGQADQALTLPETAATRYFILSRVTGAAGGSTSGTLLAEALPFTFLDAGPTEVGAGEVTLEIHGAQMPNSTTFSLVSSEGLREEIPAARVVDLGGSRFEATFDLRGRAGTYDLLGQAGSDMDVFAEPIVVGPQATAALAANVEGVRRVRVGQAMRGSITATNFGNTDVQVGQLLVSLPAIGPDIATLVLSPDDPDQQRVLVTGDTLEAEAYTRLFLGRLRPFEVRVIPFELTFNEPSPVGLGIQLGPIAQTRLEYIDSDALFTLIELSDGLRDDLLSFGLDATTAGAVADRFVGDALGAWSTAIEMGRTLPCDDAIAVRDALWDALSRDRVGVAALYDGWLADVAACAYRTTLCSGDDCPEAEIARAAIVTRLAACSTEDDAECPCTLRADDPFCETAGSTLGLLRGSFTSRTDPCSGSDAFGSDGGGRPFGDPAPNECVPPPVNSFDPNDLSGPIGTGQQQWISGAFAERWRVNFENLVDASSPATTVNIVLSTPGTTSAGSFRPVFQSVAENEQDLGNGRLFASESGLTETETGREVVYQTNAGIDIGQESPEVFWNFQTIDPETGESPLDPFDGFLPRNDEEGRGEGSVEFLIRPSPLARTGDTIELQASIVFDINDPIITNTWVNTIDADVPFSSLTEQPPIAVPGPFIPLSFAGVDPAGAGLEGVRVLVSIDNGPYWVFQPPTLDTVAIYEAEGAGRLYAFATQAVDLAGNVEPLPVVPDAVTVVPSLELAMESDTGVVGDGVTSIAEPTLDLVSLPGAMVAVEFAGPVSGTAFAQADSLGRALVVLGDGQPLPEGVYSVSITTGEVLTSLLLTIVGTPPAVLRWASEMPHGDVGPVQLDLDENDTEPRVGPASTFVAEFAQAIDLATVSPSAIEISGRGVDGQAVDLAGRAVTTLVAADQRTVRIVIEPALAAGRYCVSIEGVRSISGVEALEPQRVAVNLVPGDVSADLRTNATDLGFAREAIVDAADAPIDPLNLLQVRADVNGDGLLTAEDLDVIRGSRGLDLRTIAPGCGAVVATRPNAEGADAAAALPTHMHLGSRSANPAAAGRSDAAPASGSSYDGPTLPLDPRLIAGRRGWRVATELLAFDSSLAADINETPVGLWDDISIVRFPTAGDADAIRAHASRKHWVAPVIVTDAGWWVVPAADGTSESGWDVLESAARMGLEPGWLAAIPKRGAGEDAGTGGRASTGDPADRELSGLGTGVTVLVLAGDGSGPANAAVRHTDYLAAALALPSASRSRVVVAGTYCELSRRTLVASPELAALLDEDPSAAVADVHGVFGLLSSAELNSIATPPILVVPAWTDGLEQKPMLLGVASAVAGHRAVADNRVTWHSLRADADDAVIFAAAGIALLGEHANVAGDALASAVRAGLVDRGPPGPDTKFGVGVLDPLQIARTLRVQTDLTGDGVATQDDVVRMLRALAAGDAMLGDINGDGRVDPTDLEIVRRAARRDTGSSPAGR